MGNQLSSNKDIRKIVKKARKEGWVVTKAKSNHLQFYPPDNYEDIIVMSSTPASTRNFKNILMKLRAKGLDV
jgi:predicted RNA binding protein YcfA (HicA-like mRNA interferase family)